MAIPRAPLLALLLLGSTTDVAAVPAAPPDDWVARSRALADQPHRPTLAPELQQAIREAYPGDEATGFEPGQLRGAVIVRWPAGN